MVFPYRCPLTVACYRKNWRPFSVSLQGRRCWLLLNGQLRSQKFERGAGEISDKYTDKMLAMCRQI